MAHSDFDQPGKQDVQALLKPFENDSIWSLRFVSTKLFHRPFDLVLLSCLEINRLDRFHSTSGMVSSLETSFALPSLGKWVYGEFVMTPPLLSLYSITVPQQSYIATPFCAQDLY